jgi:hypothetical protein
MFYNPETNDIKTHKELCVLTETSIPKNFEFFQGYYKVYTEKPSVTSIYQNITENPITFIDGKYVITYNISYIPIEEIKQIKYKHIEEKFQIASSTAFITSSYGFRVDANDIANRNVDGLIKIMKVENESNVLFRDYDNNFHNITLEELETIQIEIIKNGKFLYKQKWDFLNDISSLTKEHEVIAYNISYKNMDFTK